MLLIAKHLCTVLNNFKYSLLFWGEHVEMYYYIISLCISMSLVFLHLFVLCYRHVMLSFKRYI